MPGPISQFKAVGLDLRIKKDVKTIFILSYCTDTFLLIVCVISFLNLDLDTDSFVYAVVNATVWRNRKLIEHMHPLCET